MSSLSRLESYCKDEMLFNPNLSPRDIIERGAFGGSYFGIEIGIQEKDNSRLFEELFKGLDEELYLSKKYISKKNKFKVKSGMGYDYWKAKGWINEIDPRGWFEWYCNYYSGRRTEDDSRQIKRWIDFCSKEGRWRNNLYRKIHQTGDWNISPRICQSLLHWGYEMNVLDYKEYVDRRM